MKNQLKVKPEINHSTTRRPRGKHARKDPDDGRDDALDQENHCDTQTQRSVKTGIRLRYGDRALHSHDRTRPIESILRIPLASSPPKAPARGEQTGHRRRYGQLELKSMDAQTDSPRYMANLKASSLLGYHRDR